eukprot:TRINITY_DN3204_c0_g2_i1.p1 TRINITY_DN3204_c0_g2~~TRINITY_DN3204_c0_g2_i1.p1  ORF type:complete len:197 (-),score=26.05 TRINITY_DN3204_c0_g2_i1:146-736(-)
MPIKKPLSPKQQEKELAMKLFWKQAKVEVQRLRDNNSLWHYVHNQFTLDHSIRLRRAFDRRLIPFGAMTTSCTATIGIPHFEFVGYVLPILLGSELIKPVVPTFHHFSKRGELVLKLKNIKLKRLGRLFTNGLFDDRPWTSPLVSANGPSTGFCRFREYVQVEYSTLKGLFKIRYSYDVYRTRRDANGEEVHSYLR